MTPSGTHVLLLRGINVGGHHRLPMAWLRQTAVKLGGDNAETYLASGNLIVTLAPSALVLVFVSGLRAAIATEHGFEVPILAVTADAVRSAAASVPFTEQSLGAPLDPKLCHVAFLDATPTPTAAATLLARDFDNDQVVIDGARCYLWYPDGSHSSRLTLDRIERDLAVTGTARNLATVRSLAERV